MTDNELILEYKIEREKCTGVDRGTGWRDCWNFSCRKDHTWRYYEILKKNKMISEKDKIKSIK